MKQSSLKRRAKELAKKPTKAEITFRRRLLDAKIPFAFQKVVGFYIPDFIILERMLIVELDGEVHVGREDYDARRTQWLQSFGFKVLRIANRNASTFDLNRLQDYPRSNGYQKAVIAANIARNGITGEKRKPDVPEIIVRKSLHKSGHVKMYKSVGELRKISQANAQAFAKRKVRVVKSDK